MKTIPFSGKTAYNEEKSLSIRDSGTERRKAMKELELNLNTREGATPTILAGLNSPVLTGEQNATEASLEELEALLETAGGKSVGTVLQNKATPDPKFFLGEGTVQDPIFFFGGWPCTPR